ncbi:GntR family transcriptional regulator [Neobacillus mesonae]|uniref:GntR family transcriptional regulator n=1 Tax=Neobacillus mesonae TaxID=1193713 RepID=A0A3T0HVB4_9BACI|nr:GntR family transcriptional regulator [Neobacillus mesonae]AZU61100.1 GntR family transcriptional regulator [Neobacillus mesonae]MED4205976.1 GntR family transcriptional regulator [Neobacillus mesonae]
MINKNSPIPLYYQLEEYIKGLIEKGELKPGDALPPEREYAETNQISRMTVRQAFTQLVNEGYLYRIQGKGTFVAERKIEQPLQGLTSFTEDMKARGLVPGSQLIHFETIAAPNGVAKQLLIPEAAPIYEISRIRLADGVPMALETSFISAELITGLTEEIVNQSLYAYMEEQLKLTIESSTQIIEASIANKEEAEYLQISEGAPVMLIQNIAYLEDRTPVEFVKSVFRADRYKFMIQKKRQKLSGN